MKIAHVTTYPPKGEKHVSGSGVGSYTKNLLTHMQPGDEHVVVGNIDGGEASYTEDGIHVRRVFRRGPAFLWQIHRELKAIQPDVVHIQQELALFGGPLTAYLLQWLVLLWRQKTVITLHGVVDPNRVDAAFVRENNSHLPVWLVRLAFRVIYTPLAKWATRVVVHEDYFKRVLIDAYRIRPDKIDVTPHGVEAFTPMDKTEARQQLGLPEQANIVLFMGYATGYKGLDLLIEGFTAYAVTHPSAYLVIGAGKHPKLTNDPEYLEEYDRLVTKAQALPEGQYEWRGFIEEDEIGAYYSASDVSVYPYTTAMSSSGPMSFAIGYEKPFLVSDAFEQVFSQYPQLLFARKPARLAALLDYFFSHPREYAGVSRTLKEERAWERVARRTTNTYRKITDREGVYEAEESTAAW